VSGVSWLRLSSIAPICSLLTGFPDLASSARGFSIAASGALPAHVSKIDVSVGWFVRKADPDRQGFSLEPVQRDLFDETESFPALVLDIAGRKRVIPVDRVNRMDRHVYARAEAEAG
jgi:hypothetical protein